MRWAWKCLEKSEMIIEILLGSAKGRDNLKDRGLDW
jgi:hypothetical protein